MGNQCLSLDLEVGVRDTRIHGFAGVRSDTGQPLIGPKDDSLAKALTKLDGFADGVDFILGHNLIYFDLPHLKAANPGLRLLQLPAVDTLGHSSTQFSGLSPQPLPSSGQALPGRSAQARAHQRP